MSGWQTPTQVAGTPRGGRVVGPTAAGSRSSHGIVNARTSSLSCSIAEMRAARCLSSLLSRGWQRRPQKDFCACSSIASASAGGRCSMTSSTMPKSRASVADMKKSRSSTSSAGSQAETRWWGGEGGWRWGGSWWGADWVAVVVVVCVWVCVCGGGGGGDAAREVRKGATVVGQTS